MKLRNQSGQTIIALLIFMMLAITVTTTAVAVTIANFQATTSLGTGEVARADAETGLENAFEQLLRNPSYAGETMTLASGTATITVSGTTTRTIVSVGAYGRFKRTITATASYTSNVLTLASWNETP